MKKGILLSKARSTRTREAIQPLAAQHGQPKKNGVITLGEAIRQLAAQHAQPRKNGVIITLGEAIQVVSSFYLLIDPFSRKIAKVIEEPL